MKDEPGCGRGGVDVLGETAEARALGLMGVDDLQEILQRAREPVVPGDHHDVAQAELVEEASNSGRWRAVPVTVSEKERSQPAASSAS